jgi:photosystem II stability/assembly factor-like uncharacterized protein
MAQDVKVFDDLGLYGGQMYDIAIDPGNPDRMFVGSYLVDGLLKSVDGADSWEAVVTNYKSPEGESSNSEGEFRNHAVYAVKMAPGNPNIIWAANNYWVEKSEDGGETWTHILNGDMQKKCVNCMPCLTSETNEWPDWPDCENFRFIRTIAIDQNNNQTVYVGTTARWGNYDSTEGAMFKTSDGGASWVKINGGNNFDHNINEIAIDPQDSSVLWAVTTPWDSLGDAGTLYRSEDGGDTWKVIYSMVDEGHDEAFSAVAVKPNDSNVVFTGSGLGVMKHFYEDNQWKTSLDIVPGSAEVEDIIFDLHSPETVYATWGGEGTGYIARSTDGGESWEIYQHVYDFWTLEIHPVNPEIIFASDFNQGVLKSIDHGQSWSPVNVGINNVIVYDVTVAPNNSKHILVGTISGVYEKKGEGEWIPLLTSMARSVEFHPANSQIFFAGLGTELGKTLDGGQTWTFSNQIGGRVTDIAIDDTNTNTLFISAGDGKIYKSENEGDMLSEVLSSTDGTGEAYSFNAVVIDPSDNQHIFAGGGNFFSPKKLGFLWESIDGGSTWNPTSLRDNDEEEEGIIINALLINPDNPNIIYAGAGYSGGTKNPLYKSMDGGTTWSPAYDGIPTDEVEINWNSVTDLEFHKVFKNIIYASTSNQGIYVSDQAAYWLNLGTPEYDVYSIATSSLYAGTERGLVQLTGTGVVTGNVTDAESLSRINSATVFNDLGAKSITVDGSYIMVSSAGMSSVTAVAANHANTTASDVLVLGGDVAWVDIVMESGVSDPSVITDEENVSHSGASGGKACFVATAAYGSSMAREVEILRDFRDTFLLPHTIGKKLVSLYYNNGKSAADYLDSHSWLKPLVRILLYPLIGISWLMLSTSAIGKIFIGLCFMAGLVVLAHTIRGRRIE